VTTPPYPGIQVAVKPGGLTTNQHILHVIIAALTCGIWLPIYLLIALGSPVKRVEVFAPPGTPPTAIEAARAQAMVLSPDEEATASRKRIGLALVLGGTLVLLIAVCVGVTRTG
jgi:hypothetical protein